MKTSFPCHRCRHDLQDHFTTLECQICDCDGFKTLTDSAILRGHARAIRKLAQGKEDYDVITMTYKRRFDQLQAIVEGRGATWGITR